MVKCRRAIEQTGFSTLIVAGGVSANLTLRQIIDEMAKKLNVNVHYPGPEFCTDNGAMIALAGHYRLISGQRNNHYEILVKPRWNLEELEAI